MHLSHAVALSCMALVSTASAVNVGAPIAPRVVGSSGSHAQMAFLVPFTNTVTFIDNYHPNFGNGIDLATGAHSKTPFQYPNSNEFVFGTEYDLATNAIRALKPISNTFCSAGAFFPNGTLLNTGGAEPCTADGNCFGATPVVVQDGFAKMRTLAAGPCAQGACTQDWIEGGNIQRRRWYQSMQTMTDGSILMLGGSNKGLLVTNAADINEPNYEIAHLDGSLSPVTDFPFLNFGPNDGPDKSYNLYPILHLLPNAAVANQIFTYAGSNAIVFDYQANKLVKNLPGLANVRTFPASAMSVLLPLTPANNYQPEVMICGGATGDAPNPLALNDCGRIQPLADNPQWVTETMPDGARVMGDMILLPNGQLFIVNGARQGMGGGFMAEQPALAPMIYDPNAAAGKRFTVLPASTIPRLYHSVAILLPSGEVLVAGSNPAVFYAPPGSKVPQGYPLFNNNGVQSPLHQQQAKDSSYPTEYRVEIFSPPYMSAAQRPAIQTAPQNIAYNQAFNMQVDAQLGCDQPVTLQLIQPAFGTHGVHMGQRMVELTVNTANCGQLSAVAPPNASIMPPGPYLLFAVQDGIPSKGVWVTLG